MDERTPWSANPATVFSASARGPPVITSRSVPARPVTPPSASISVPPVPTKGLPLPSSAAPMASIALRSSAIAPR